MENFDVLHDIAQRTGGDIYVGVVGPVRTGKSTFIKRFMELMILPNIKNAYDKERSIDELPQGGAGKTITTTEPKFVPNEAVEISIDDGVRARVRLVDCVGYSVEGALGYEDNEGPRMVSTPWFDRQVPFQEAAEVGTKKVISDHSTIGLVITTDGSITDIGRENYVSGEERVISELKGINKPFGIILNSTEPFGKRAEQIARELEEKYEMPVTPMDCKNMDENDALKVLREILYEFPIRELNIELPDWFEALDQNHWLYKEIRNLVIQGAVQVFKLRDVDNFGKCLEEGENVHGIILDEIDPGRGRSSIEIRTSQKLYFQILQEITGLTIEGDNQLLKLMKELVYAKKEYDKVASGLNEVKEMGYGVVAPALEEIDFEEPELIRQGNRFGVKLTANAPSIHLIKTNIKAEVTPFVGTEKQGEELVKRLNSQFETEPAKIWKTDFLGMPMHDILQESLENKLYRMPEKARERLRETLEKIVNEGSGGLICIIL